MREPPADLTTDMLEASLRADYGLTVTELDFLPLGQDASASAYRVRTTAGQSYFLKVRRHLTNTVSLLVPRHLNDQGISQVVAPLPTSAGALSTTAGRYVVILYPFITGATGMARGLTAQQWIEFGSLLRRVHTSVLTPSLARLVKRDAFVPMGADMLRRLQAHLADTTLSEPVTMALAQHWQARQSVIGAVLQQAEELGQRLAATAPPSLLCHADIHTNNVMLDETGRLWIVDWDETIVAPRERDLMFVIGGISRRLVGPDQEALFLQGYGTIEVDRLALAYYRYAWAVSDISAYGEQICFRPDLGAITRQESVEFFQSLFRPGAIVDIALGSAIPTS